MMTDVLGLEYLCMSCTRSNHTGVVESEESPNSVGSTPLGAKLFVKPSDCHVTRLPTVETPRQCLGALPKSLDGREQFSGFPRHCRQFLFKGLPGLEIALQHALRVCTDFIVVGLHRCHKRSTSRLCGIRTFCGSSQAHAALGLSLVDQLGYLWGQDLFVICQELVIPRNCLYEIRNPLNNRRNTS